MWPHTRIPLSETGVREANSSRFDRLEEGMDTLEEKVTGIQMTSSVPTPKLWVMPVWWWRWSVSWWQR